MNVVVLCRCWTRTKKAKAWHRYLQPNQLTLHLRLIRDIFNLIIKSNSQLRDTIDDVETDECDVEKK